MGSRTFLNIDDLYTNHIKRDKHKLRFYEEIYQKCIKKIQKVNKELRHFECCFSVPVFIFGGPLYDYEDLKRYLVFKLHNNGLSAEYLDNKTLYISWKPEDVNRYKYEKSLARYKKNIEVKYNVSDKDVSERTIKHKKGARDNVTTTESKVGVLQYNSHIKDMIPINPDKIRKYNPVEQYPTVPRPNNQTMMMNSRAIEKSHLPTYQ